MIVGALRIKNEPRIAEVVKSLLPICDRVIIFDDHSTDDTIARASVAPGVSVIESPFPETVDESRDKNYLLTAIRKAGPEWVIWIDGDEVLRSRDVPKLREALEKSRDAASFSFRICYLWDDDKHIRVDGIYQNFRRARAFRLHKQPSGLAFPKTTFGGNFHCSNIPRGLRGGRIHLPVWLKHYGYMEPAERRRKFEWYNKIDPNNHHEDGYKHIVGRPSRHAPGPVRLVPWIE